MVWAVSPWDRSCTTYGTHECSLPKNCIDTSQWACHNYSCRMRAVEILQALWNNELYLYNYSQEGRSISNRPLWKQFCKWLWHKHTLVELLLCHSLWMDKACSLSEVYWTLTRDTSGHETVLTPSVNVGIMSASASIFGSELMRTLSQAALCYLTGWLLNNTVIFWKNSRAAWGCA